MGSNFRLASQIHKTPKRAANDITKREFEELLTPTGSSSMPSNLLCKLLLANRLNEPPLCSKNDQKKIEKTFFLMLVHRDIFLIKLIFIRQCLSSLNLNDFTFGKIYF